MVFVCCNIVLYFSFEKWEEKNNVFVWTFTCGTWSYCGSLVVTSDGFPQVQQTVHPINDLEERKVSSINRYCQHETGPGLHSYSSSSSSSYCCCCLATWLLSCATLTSKNVREARVVAKSLHTRGRWHSLFGRQNRKEQVCTRFKTLGQASWTQNAWRNTTRIKEIEVNTFGARKKQSQGMNLLLLSLWNILSLKYSTFEYCIRWWYNWWREKELFLGLGGRSRVTAVLSLVVGLH